MSLKMLCLGGEFSVFAHLGGLVAHDLQQYYMPAPSIILLSCWRAANFSHTVTPDTPESPLSEIES